MKVSYISHGIQFGSDLDSMRAATLWIDGYRLAGYNVITINQPNGDTMCVAEKHFDIDTDKIEEIRGSAYDPVVKGYSTTEEEPSEVIE